MTEPFPPARSNIVGGPTPAELAEAQGRATREAVSRFAASLEPPVTVSGVSPRSDEGPRNVQADYAANLAATGADLPSFLALILAEDRAALLVEREDREKLRRDLIQEIQLGDAWPAVASELTGHTVGDTCDVCTAIQAVGVEREDQDRRIERQDDLIAEFRKREESQDRIRERLTAERDALAAERDALLARAVAAEARAEKAEASIAELVDHLSAATDDLDETQAERDELRAKVAAVEAELAHCTAACVSARRDRAVRAALAAASPGDEETT